MPEEQTGLKGPRREGEDRFRKPLFHTKVGTRQSRDGEFNPDDDRFRLQHWQSRDTPYLRAGVGVCWFRFWAAWMSATWRRRRHRSTGEGGRHKYEYEQENRNCLHSPHYRICRVDHYTRGVAPVWPIPNSRRARASTRDSRINRTKLRPTGLAGVGLDYATDQAQCARAIQSKAPVFLVLGRGHRTENLKPPAPQGSP